LVIAGKSASLRTERGGPKVDVIPDHVDRKTYVRLLEESRVILLPYEAARYSESTSGIFIEAVIAGAIPIVTKETWMASELIKFGLEQLTTNWQPKDLPRQILAACANREIASRLAAMCRHYRLFHSVDAYAREMKHLSDRTHAEHTATVQAHGTVFTESNA
jgi:glycosyltransferase involved in cell wall biosynthesis